LAQLESLLGTALLSSRKIKACFWVILLHGLLLLLLYCPYYTVNIVLYDKHQQCKKKFQNAQSFENIYAYAYHTLSEHFTLSKMCSYCLFSAQIYRPHFTETSNDNLITTLCTVLSQKKECVS